MRVLLVEDDPLLGDGLRAGLRQQRFQVDWVRDGAVAECELRAKPCADRFDRQVADASRHTTALPRSG